MRVAYLSPLANCGAMCGVTALLTACQSHPLPTRPPEKIFRKGRQLTYTVTHEAKQTSGVDTILLTSYGDYKPGEYDPTTTQIKIGFSYDGHSTPNNFAGVIENDTMLWSHPPRGGSYAILQLSPYPYIKLPVTMGRTWSWELTVGSQWGNPRWGTWPGNIVVRSHYQVVGQQTVPTALGRLQCWVVQAHASSPVGTSRLKLLYHPTYGFVGLHYQTIDGQHTNLTLAKAGMQYGTDYLRSLPGQVNTRL